MAFIEMDFASGGSGENQIWVSGTTPVVSTSFTEIECGFKPQKISITLYINSSNGASYDYTLNSDETSYSKVGVWKSGSSGNVVSSTSDANFLPTETGFKIKAASTDSLAYGYQHDYIAIGTK